MALWIAEYPLNIPHETPQNVFSGMIGNEIWLVNQVERLKIQMFVFSIDARKWIKVEYTNTDFVESYYQEIEEGHEEGGGQGGEEEDEDDAIVRVAMTNGKLYMIQSCETRPDRLLEFDREGLEWKLLKQFDNTIEVIDCVVVNDKMYIFNEFGVENDIILKVMCMNTLEIIENVTYTWMLAEHATFIYMVHNGVIYISFVDENGKRSLYSIAEHSYNPVKLFEETDGETIFTNVFLYERNDNIYQVHCENEQLIMECFDFDKKVWKDKRTLKMEHELSGVFGKDGKVYVAWDDEEAETDKPLCGIRVFDPDPKLSTICSLAIARDTPKDDVNRRKRKLPSEIGCQLDDALSIQSYVPPKKARVETDDSSEDTLKKESAVEPEPSSP